MGTFGGPFGPVIATKLAPAKLSGRFVGREGIRVKLGEARHRTLLVIAAPAGWGKSTLAAAWRKELVTEGADAAWLQLGEEENSLYQFVQSMIVSLLGSGCTGLADVVDLFTQGSAFDPGLFITPLLNTIQAHKRDVFLFIEEFQRATDPSVLALVQRILELAPANLHLVLLSRGAPALPLAKLRLAERLVEIGVADLRFSLAEADEFLSRRLGFQLSADDMRLVYDLAEGWPAGLQMLAVSLRSAEDKGKQLREALAHAGPLADYLTEEAMMALDLATRNFLVAISPCRKFTADLCQTLTAMPDAAEKLARLEVEFHFVQPLEGDKPGWRRLSPIIRHFLEASFAALPAESRAALHRQASQWFAAHGDEQEAVHHALLCGDTEFAVKLAEQSVWRLFLDENMTAILAWAGQLPEESIGNSPKLMIALAWTLMLCGKVAESEAIIGRISRSPFLNDRWVRFCIASIRAVAAIQRDDGIALLQIVSDCAGFLDIEDKALRGALCNHTSYAYLQLDDFVGARDMQRIHREIGDHGSLTVSIYGQLAEALSYMEAGDAAEAGRLCAALLASIEPRRGRRSGLVSMTASFYAEVLYEQNRLEELRQALANRMDIASLVSVPPSLLSGMLGRARLRLLSEGCAAALADLDELDQLGRKLGLARFRAWALGEKIKLQLADWRLVPAQRLMAELTALVAPLRAEARCMMRELGLVHDMSLARLHMAAGRYAEAAALLEPLRAEWEGRGRLRIACQLRALRAVALAKADGLAAALVELRPALEIAERYGLVRSIVDEGSQMQPLLAAIGPDEKLHAYTGRLLAEIAPKPEMSAAGPVPAAEARPLLSVREADILQLMGKAMTNKRIALALEISGETVKWHLKNIFAKLDVTARADAIAKARRLGLIP